eukprot:11864-Eustigmatos_ZCMA.PRE.1
MVTAIISKVYFSIVVRSSSRALLKARRRSGPATSRVPVLLWRCVVPAAERVPAVDDAVAGGPGP